MKLWRSIGVVAILCTLLASCGAGSTNESSNVVKIGFFGPLTGDSASDGINARNAAQLAVDKANAEQLVPGKTFELVAYDDRLDATETANLIQKLISDDKVQAVVSGSYSTPSRAAAPLLQQAGIPMVTAYAVHPEITTAGDMIFRMIYTGPTQGKAMAVFALTKLGYKNFHVLYLDNDYGKSISEGFKQTVEASGGQISSMQSFGSSDSDFTPQLTGLQSQPADALVLVGYYAQSAQIIQQAHRLGIDLPVLGSDGLDSPKLLELAGQDAEGVILATDFSRDDPRTQVQDFIRRYQEKYNTVPDIVSSSAYDATMLLIDAVKRSTSTEPKAIRDAIAATTTFEGVTGTISFKPDREVNKTVLFVQIDKGKFTFLNKLEPGDLQ